MKKKAIPLRVSSLVLLLASIIIGVGLIKLPKYLKRNYASTMLQYKSINLGSLGGGDTEARAFNEKGQIVGYSTDSQNQRRAFIWENGVMRDLGTLGGDFAEAYNINEKGQVVGTSNTSGNQSSHAFIWENGVMRDLGTLGGNYSTAYDLNENGQVVGSSQIVGTFFPRAFLWENGVMQNLGTLANLSGNYGSTALGINETGQVVGYSNTATGIQHAFLWENDVIKDLGSLSTGDSFAFDINDSGKIVGYSYINASQGQAHAFYWDNNQMTDLGTLGGPSSGAHAINNKGDIIGYSDDNRTYRNTVIWINGQSFVVNAPNPTWYDIDEAENFISRGQLYKKLINGLRGSYFPNNSFSGTSKISRVDQNISFNWDKASPDPTLPKDDFSVKWEGFIVGKTDGLHTFHIEHDDSARLWINDQLVIDAWEKGKQQSSVSNPIYLSTNYTQKIRLEYVEFKNTANVSLSWSTESNPVELIAPDFLYSD